MADTKALKTKRGQIKAKLTRFETFLSNTKGVKVVEIQRRLTDIENVLNEFNSVQDDIEQNDPDDNSVQDEVRQEFETSFYKLTCQANELCIEGTPAPVSQGCANQSALTNNIQLPIIKLPEFNGNYDDWFKFKDTFVSIVHNNSSLSATIKFQYLNSCIRGEAASAIHSLKVSDANYKVAWTVLCERYDNEHLIIKKHVRDLFNLPNINKESPSQLRSLIDSYKKHVRSLKALDETTEHWGTLLIHLIASKLDSITYCEWEKHSTKEKLTEIDDLINFLNEKCHYLESVKSNFQQNVGYNKDQMKVKHNAKAFSTTVNSNFECFSCGGSHLIYNCNDFLNLTIKNRISRARQLKLCLNCLRKNHRSTDCKSGSCRQCNKNHNSLLHLNETNINDATSSAVTNQASTSKSQSSTVAKHALYNSSTVLLSTAILQVFDKFGRMHKCRALLDNGSQSNFISQRLTNMLGLPTKPVSVSICGITQKASHVTNFISIKIQARHDPFNMPIDCLILPKVTENLPLISFNPEILNLPKNILLADPGFYESSTIDILLGASVFWKLLCIGQIHLGKNSPVIQKTRLGWIISGDLPTHNNKTNKQSMCHFSSSLETAMARFWEIEEVDCKPQCSPEENSCENIFTQTTSRDATGRFTVRLPFRDNIHNLGESRHSALKRFYSLERKLENNATLKFQYTKFMQEYITLGHMSKLSNDHSGGFYLPHHAVFKDSSKTTKLRVVFDGSAKTSSGLSLNDCLMVGPVLQDDLFGIVLRFRKHSVVLSADISKMYRQTRVHEDDIKYQKIFWRERKTDPIQTFTLNTVTYGTSAASFLAIRCLQEVAKRSSDKFPEACSIIMNEFYVDDLLTGTDTAEHAIQIQSQITSVLRLGGFDIRKWNSNSAMVIKNIPQFDQPHIISISENNEFKTLGLQWNSELDCLQYTSHNARTGFTVTKRNILSSVAQLFDPLGLLGPIVIVGKLIIQSLWQCKLDWDESLPSEMHNLWNQFHNNLENVNLIKIPRHVILANSTHVEMHGFSDASEKAYGACIYLKSIDNEGSIAVKLLCAKSRVAPLKNISLPRLELCGALLLAQLANKVKHSIKLDISKHFYWCDSTIVLAWINAPSNRWKTFVANRVAEIQNLSSSQEWNHVDTKENPADMLSRGIDSITLCDSQLWWHGPRWLNIAHIQATSTEYNYNDVPEMRNITVANLCVVSFEIFDRFSSLERLQRNTAFCIRFINNLKVAREIRLKGPLYVAKEIRLTGPLSVAELSHSLTSLIKLAQRQSFSRELHDLKSNKCINPKSSLITLSPFLDNEGQIRVGGRLKQSDFDYNKKHPILLPSKHALTELILKFYHKKLLHAGSNLLLCNIRELYWPISGKNATKKVIRECIQCFKANPGKTMSPVMGELPKPRITPTRPFFNSGVDYAGPIQIRDRKSRGYKITKAYICVFICFSTKALHIELVSDLTGEAFIAALRRFAARRGRCAALYSDNGTNFVGANKELQNFLIQSKNQIADTLSSEGIEWHFMPPRTPHFGGLWEAGVKSIKRHLKRVIFNAVLTYEELYTVLTQIEACLNSRPLCPLSNDPNDYLVLTPGHFLIGDSLTSLPDANVTDIKETRLSRYQRCQQLLQHFWKRWSVEYVTTLQQRKKWNQESAASVPIGTMVLIKEDNTPPLAWKLGRVSLLHSGKDGVVRVVTVRTSQGEFKRAVHKLVPLPIEDNFPISDN